VRIKNIVVISTKKENNCVYAILVSSENRKKAHEFYENLGFIDGVKEALERCISKNYYSKCFYI